jgi:sensor histidine kinase YesM
LRNKVTASQLTALKSQMNPHFLFNTLNSLQDLILKHDIKNSNYYLNKFSVLMREVLDISGKDEISLVREIKLLDTYLELEKLRFGDEFNFFIKCR